MFTRIRVNWRGMSAENYGTFLYIFPPRYTRDVPDEIICALAAIRIPESRTCHLVETDQDQKVGGEGASQISRTRASQDWNRRSSGTNPVARTGRRPVAGLTNIRVNYSCQAAHLHLPWLSVKICLWTQSSNQASSFA